MQNIFRNIFLIHKHFIVFVPILIFIGINFIYNDIYYGLVMFPLFILSCLLSHKNDEFRLINYIFLFISLGMIAMLTRNYIKPELTNLSRGIYNITGVVEKFSYGNKKHRVIINKIDGYTGKIQLSTNKVFNVGDKIKAKAFVFPPSKPIIKGAFDFSKYARYKQIIGYGKILQVDIIQKKKDIKLVNKITNYLYKNIPSETASVASALITGNRSGIDKQNLNNLRVSGLAHLLAISGLHIGLVIGSVYFLLRFLLIILFFNHTTKYSIKNICGIASLIVAFLYAGLADYPIPTIRAFIMAFIVIFALLFNRQVLNIRSVALVASFISVIMPESIYSPSFHLSFIAVFSLVGFFQIYKVKMKGIKGFFTGVIMSSLIVQIVTSPFIIYHFGMFSLYSVIANVIAIPLMTFFIAPFLLLSVFEMIIFGTPLFIKISAIGLNILLHWAEFITNLDYSSFYLPKFSVYGLIIFLMMILTFVIAKLEKNKFLLRLSSLLLIVGIIISIIPNNKPLIFVVNKNTILVKDGNHYVVNKKISSFLSNAVYRQTGLRFKNDKICNSETCKVKGVIITNNKKYKCNQNAKIVIAPNALIKSCHIPSIDITDMYTNRRGYQINKDYTISVNN